MDFFRFSKSPFWTQLMLSVLGATAILSAPAVSLEPENSAVNRLNPALATLASPYSSAQAEALNAPLIATYWLLAVCCLVAQRAKCRPQKMLRGGLVCLSQRISLLTPPIRAGPFVK